MYVNVYEDLDKDNKGLVQGLLKGHMIGGLGFESTFATWLTENLFRLNDTAIKLLASLDKEDHMYVRLAIVSTFDYEKQLPLFKSRARTLLRHLPINKVTVVEAAINLTNTDKIELNMAQLGEVIKAVRDLGNLPKGKPRTYKALTLDKWPAQVKNDTTSDVVHDKNDIVAAFLSISDRHVDLKGKEELVTIESSTLVKIFGQADKPINYLQQATAALAYLNHE